MKHTQIIINNRNRLTSLCELITWFIDRGYDNLTVLDNDSSYPPLLEYYEALEGLVNVVRLRNLLSKALWCWTGAREYVRDPFVYTDSDVVPGEDCPDDLVAFLAEVSKVYGMPNKVGLGLKIDDIPDHYAAAPMVRSWEGQFWERQIGDVRGVPIFSAGVDSTFAYYPEFRPFSTDAIRTGAPYIARHVPWYIDSAKPSYEEQYYIEHAASGCHTWSPDGCKSSVVNKFYSQTVDAETVINND